MASSDTDPGPVAPTPAELTRRQQYIVLAAAFAAWMFAGSAISLFILISRQIVLGLLGPETAEAVVTQWFAWYQAAFLFGAAAGGWTFGALGDRLGRTRAMGLSVLCYSGFTLACYFVDDPWVMLVLRGVACMGIGGVWPNAVALVAEAWPDASRPFLAGLLGTAANVGFVLLGAVCYVSPATVDSWRWVLLVGSSPLLVGLWVLAAVPESRRWLASRSPAVQQDGSPLAAVLRPPLLSRTLLGIALGAVPVVGTAANASWLTPWSDQVAQQAAAASEAVESESTVAAPRSASTAAPRKASADPRSKARTQIVRSSGAAIGSLLGGLIASWLGRRVTYFLISLGALATSTYIFTQIDPLHPYFQTAVFVLGFVGVTYFGWLPLFLPELFPTRVRSTGAGISFNTGRVVAAFFLLGTGFLVDVFRGNYAQIGFWSGMIYLVGMVIIWFAPRSDAGRITD
jgi:SHS family sialic acid transporter-like MFS transporter